MPKKCKVCKKPIKRSLRGMCRNCYNRWWVRQNPDKNKRRWLKYRKSAKWKETRKRYEDEHKEEFLSWLRAYRKRPEVKIRLREHSWLKTDNGKKWLSNWREVNKVKLKEQRGRLKERVLAHYGRVCACCGEKESVFLTIDHIKGGGSKHRKAIGSKTYRWLINNNFPKGFQTLCFNCNWAKYSLGECPHNKSKR